MSLPEYLQPKPKPESTIDRIPWGSREEVIGPDYDYRANQVPFVSGITDAMFAEMCRGWRRREELERSRPRRDNTFKK